MYSKAIILDLDGTILHDDKTISSKTIDVLNKCKEKNICIIVATARSEMASKKYISQINPQAIISNGGALVTLHDRIIYEKSLSYETTNGIIQKCLSHNTGTITVENYDGYFWNTPEEAYTSDYAHGIYTDFTLYIKPAYKITVDIDSLSLAQSIANEFDDCDMLTFTGENWRRFAHKKATKTFALDILLRELEINLSDAISFGDDYIDIEMIKHCGTGVAVGNAIAELKNEADYITDTNNNDGVANYISEFLL